MINRSPNVVRALAVQAILLFAGFTGAGAAAPTITVGTVLPTKDNYATAHDGNTTTITRNGAGDYTFVFCSSPAAILMVHAGVRGTADLVATVSSWSISSGRLTVQVKTWTPAGVATDITSAEFLRLTIIGNLSNA